MADLPAHLQPVTICLHAHDLGKGRDAPFTKAGFPVVTAGDPTDDAFPDRRYDLLRRHRFSASNSVGSYTFYSIEMGSRSSDTARTAPS